MFYLFLILVFFYLVGDKKPKKENNFTQLERDLFISDVISGKRKL